mmetsp:Transcript_36171/g.112978  ORF Transcript_36171/g.112978 Transcript_36171/m.112978 type:complete len:155 (-) Transcript_36171:343-807(-)
MTDPHAPHDTEPLAAIFPRRSFGNEEVRAAVQVSLPQIAKLFHLKQSEAADILGISLTALKNTCRKLGVKKWPYARKRSLCDLEKLQEEFFMELEGKARERDGRGSATSQSQSEDGRTSSSGTGGYESEDWEKAYGSSQEELWCEAYYHVTGRI